LIDTITLDGRKFQGITQALTANQDDYILARLRLAGAVEVMSDPDGVKRTKEQRAEDLLKDSEERMTFAAAAANIGLWQFDRDTDEMWVTEHGKALFGLPRDAPLTRKAFLAAVHPDDLEIANLAIQRSSKAERPASIRCPSRELPILSTRRSAFGRVRNSSSRSLQRLLEIH